VVLGSREARLGSGGKDAHSLPSSTLHLIEFRVTRGG
jgi:hypothetical protein